MTVFYAIAAMSENRVIGAGGKIPWHLPEDFRWFKHRTMGGTLLMGRKTFRSIGRPLPGRRTIVLTRQETVIPGVEVCLEAKSLPAIEGVGWVCGGAEIYREFLPRCERLYLTRVKRQVSGEVTFPLFENVFRLDQVIHETPEFRVERWFHREHGPEVAPAAEAWPAA